MVKKTVFVIVCEEDDDTNVTHVRSDLDMLLKNHSSLYLYDVSEILEIPRRNESKS